MGLLDLVKGEFIDVIEQVDDNDKILVTKYARPGDEIKQGAKLIVRESQIALFVKGGELADILGPGTYTLSNGNLPILSKLESFKYGFRSPIKADLYFISTKQFLSNKWGTPNPVMMKDPDFNMVRVRAFGSFSFRISSGETFCKEVFGTLRKIMTYDIVQFLSSYITESIVITLASTRISVLELAARYRELAAEALVKANELTAPLGVEICNITIQNISLPDEVERMIDEQSGIGMASNDMNAFLHYQTARAMRDAAKQEGGLAGLGAGVAFGKKMADTASSAPQLAEPQDVGSKLRELKLLLDEGILTQEEFDAKKRQILGL